MKSNIVRIIGAAALAALGWVAFAQSTGKPQIQAMPSYIPVGVAASGNASTAWFHNPSTGTVLACQATAAGASLPGIQCTTAKLP